jgi:hypothetical protein
MMTVGYGVETTVIVLKKVELNQDDAGEFSAWSASHGRGILLLYNASDHAPLVCFLSTFHLVVLKVY